MSKEYLSLLNITYHYLILLMHQFAEEKRRERDSNPRYGANPYTRFPSVLWFSTKL